MALFIHIGYHKTGSTALQKSLSELQPQLSRAGWVYPPGLSAWPSHPELAWAFSAKNYPWQDRTYGLEEVKSYFTPYLEMSRDAHVILSSEEFCRMEEALDGLLQMARWLEPYDPIIIGYVRDPLEFLVSRYRHEVQEGAERANFADFVCTLQNLRSADFPERTRLWSQVFGQAVWRDYDQTHQGIWDDFVRVTGIDIAERPSSFSHGERKLHFSLCDAARLLHRADLPSTRLGSAMDALFAVSDELPGSSARTSSEGFALPPYAVRLLKSINMQAVGFADDSALERLHERIALRPAAED
jgi:hypothetical protein